jgi:hypothetical protein
MKRGTGMNEREVELKERKWSVRGGSGVEGEGVEWKGRKWCVRRGSREEGEEVEWKQRKWSGRGGNRVEGVEVYKKCHEIVSVYKLWDRSTVHQGREIYPPCLPQGHSMNNQ